MKEIKLLDCTLRDGGFVNNWNFGHGDMVNLFERSVSAGIDYIEIGFLDSREEFNMDRSITPDTDGMNRLFGELDHGASKIFGMIDYGTCPIERICDAKDSILDGIRVMVKKKTRYEALEFCGELKKKGYMVFAQPVSITGYTDEEMTDLVEHINVLKPFAMSIVDTYGLLDQTDLLHYFDLIDSRLDKNVMVGYHAHNNFQLAYSNSIALMNRDTDRGLLIDGSAFGIGKSAGNCPLELLTMYADEHLGKHYDTSQILEMIDTSIRNIYAKSPWGYQMQYYLCASNDCHPKYSQYLMKKKTLSIKSINEILKMIEPSERLAFNEEYIEKLYLDYQDNAINDEAAIKSLRDIFRGKQLLLIGPGRSIKDNIGKIHTFAAETGSIVISINYNFDGIRSDYVFLTNSKRYMQLSTGLEKLRQNGLKIIATSNVTPANGNFDYQVDYSSLIDTGCSIPDNSLPMLLRLLMKTGAKSAALAGFDGYQDRAGVNYFNADMEYDFAKDYAFELNDYTRGVIATMRKNMDITFVTESEYES